MRKLGQGGTIFGQFVYFVRREKFAGSTNSSLQVI